MIYFNFFIGTCQMFHKEANMPEVKLHISDVLRYAPFQEGGPKYKICL